MKKLILIGLMIFTVSLSYGQFSAGFEFGGNLMAADFTVDEPLLTKKAVGLNMGFIAQYNVTKNFYASMSLLLNQRGFKFAEERWALNALDFPFRIGYEAHVIENKLSLFVDGGANLEYNFHAFTKINDELVSLKIGGNEDDIKPFSTGVNFGAGMQISKIKARFSYYKGLTNLLRTSGDEWKNTVLGFSIIYFMAE